MERLIALVGGFVLDQLLGDPPTWPHPVRWLGKLIQALESLLRRCLPERLGGVLLLLLTTGTTGAIVWSLLRLGALIHPWVSVGIASLLVYAGLAVRSLARETQLVLAAGDDLATARLRLSRIVGRDTEQLSAAEIHRACIETVAENTTDAVIAPLFYAALAGPVGLWVYKAINTLDSMVGYRNERYRYFGWASARADDVANYLPARLTWLLLALAALLCGQRNGQALRLGWRDGRKHPSPNSGWGEATMAGALGVQLGGASTYGGVESFKPRLGESVEPLTEEKVRQAIRLMIFAAWLMLGMSVLLAYMISPLFVCRIVVGIAG